MRQADQALLAGGRWDGQWWNRIGAGCTPGGVRWKGPGEEAGALGARVVRRRNVDSGDRCARDEHRHGSRQPARRQERKAGAVVALGGEPWVHPAAIAEISP